MDAEKLFEKLAADRNITVEEMKARIAQRIEEGWNSCDPRSREQWRQIPCAGEMPTPEEWLRYSMAISPFLWTNTFFLLLLPCSA